MLPLILGTSTQLQKIDFSKIYKSFIQGLFVSSLICLVYASYKMYISYDSSHLFYGKLSVFLHSGYFAMYLNLGVILLLESLLTDRFKQLFKLNTIAWALVIFMGLMVVLVSSRAGLLILMFTAIYYIRYWLTSKLGFLKLYGIVVATGIICVSLLASDFAGARLKNVYADLFESNKEPPRTNNSRGMLWSVAVSLAKDSPIVGYGTGDMKDELMKRYKAGGYEFAYNHELNPHNQFIQSWLQVGILGIIGFSFMIFILFRSKNSIGIAVGIVGLGYSIIESILENQAGVTFFMFFYCLAYISSKNNNIFEPTN